MNGRVPFRPFVGIAPRRYEQAFRAGIRGRRGDIVQFDRLTACPHSGGWNEGAVTERESVAVSSIERLITMLAERGVAEDDAEADREAASGDPEAESVTTNITGEQRRESSA